MSEYTKYVPTEQPVADPVAPARLRIAIAQTNQREDPRDPDLLRASGAEIRDLITQARSAGARLVHFPEGALCAPNKRIMSSARDEVADANWSKADWETYTAELDAIAHHAGRLGIWVALPAAHRLSDDHRPHNSMYVINDHGRVQTRYDERFMSQTKINFMYTPGAGPITFEIDGLRIGCTMGIETLHPDSYADYEQRGVDLVLFSTTGRETPSPLPTPFFRNLEVYAGLYGYWISMASTLPGNSGILGPEQREPIRIEEQGAPALLVGEIESRPGNTPWLDRLRSGVYDANVVEDTRSLQRTSF